MANPIIQIILRLVFTSGLLFVIVLCAIPIYRMWFGRTVAITNFKYIRDGMLDNEAAHGFMLKVKQDLSRLQQLYQGKTDVIYYDMPSYTQKPELPKLPAGTEEIIKPYAGSILGEAIAQPKIISLEGMNPFEESTEYLGIEVQEIHDFGVEFYGLKISNLLKIIKRFFPLSNEIVASISENSQVFDVQAEIRTSFTFRNTNLIPDRYYITGLENSDDASLALACWIIKKHAPAESLIQGLLQIVWAN